MTVRSPYSPGRAPLAVRTRAMYRCRYSRNVQSVKLLSELARGSALEFAVGSGRIALPLARAGVDVVGIDLSPDMLAVTRSRPGGELIEAHAGDMTTTDLGRRFPLVYVVFNSIFNLLTQDDQVRCFENAARHLHDDGIFLVEAAVPSAWLRGRDYIAVESVEATEITLDVNRYDPVSQVLDENHVSIGAGGIRLTPISCRLAWPSELDLMARLAGLCLAHRWGGWGRPATGVPAGPAGASRHSRLNRAGAAW